MLYVCMYLCMYVCNTTEYIKITQNHEDSHHAIPSSLLLTPPSDTQTLYSTSHSRTPPACAPPLMWETNRMFCVWMKHVLTHHAWYAWLSTQSGTPWMLASIVTLAIAGRTALSTADAATEIIISHHTLYIWLKPTNKQTNKQTWIMFCYCNPMWYRQTRCDNSVLRTSQDKLQFAHLIQVTNTMKQSYLRY